MKLLSKNLMCLCYFLLIVFSAILYSPPTRASGGELAPLAIDSNPFQSNPGLNFRDSKKDYAVSPYPSSSPTTTSSITTSSPTTATSNNQTQPLPQNNQNAGADNFFKDTTYKKFEPQEDSEPFDAGYLEAKT